VIADKITGNLEKVVLYNLKCHILMIGQGWIKTCRGENPWAIWGSC